MRALSTWLYGAFWLVLGVVFRLAFHDELAFWASIVMANIMFQIAMVRADIGELKEAMK